MNFFRKEKKALSNRYPYDRAHEFHTEIRRLGVDDKGYSYLDKFRQLITEIGNALGYVRLIRSGGLNFVSSAVAYIPDIQAIDQVRPKNICICIYIYIYIYILKKVCVYV